MSMRNMVAMFGAMAVLRRIDQEEPLVLLYARAGYLAYVALTSLVYVLLHFRILARRDLTLLKVSLSSKSPSLREAFDQARNAAETAEEERQRKEGDEGGDDADQSTTSTETSTRKQNATADAPKGNAEGEDAEKKKEEESETITVMEYDLRHLAGARRSWITSSCFLAAVHYHMESVSPLVMSAVMGFIRLLMEDPLVQIHLRGTPAVAKLERPFAAEKNPLASLLKEFTPAGAAPTSADGTQATSTPQEDLHDDGDDDDEEQEDAAPPPLSSIRDDHIKSDFDDDEDKTDSKKKQ